MTTSFASAGVDSLFTITIADEGFFVGGTPGTQSFQSGYATLTCTNYVDALIVYSFYSASGTKLSEATVFSADESYTANVIMDHTGGARLGLAIANDTDLPRTYTITLKNSAGAELTTGSVTVPARSTLARFIDEVMAVPVSVGLLAIRAEDFSQFSVIGLRFTGVVFTTVPAS
jgi:hypothetical protein